MATVTLLQKQSAQNIVNRLRDKKLGRVREPLEEESDKVLFWIFNNIAREIERPFTIEPEMIFVLVKRHSPMPKTLELIVDGNPSNSIGLDIFKIKDARDVMRNVSETFNSLSNWYSEYKPYAQNKKKGSYGVLKVSVKAD